MKFRYLKADEIEVRPALIKSNGVQLLLYKDARCDMNILDETVGAENWQRDHKEINGVIYCGVGIRTRAIVPPEEADKYPINEWVWKWDAGAESNTEKEKGAASDAFKRACVNICGGIGRELYTSPFIWVQAQKIELETIGGKTRCKDNFRVHHIRVEEDKIVELAIYRTRDNSIVYKYGM